MTKSELVKAARTTSVRMGDADKLRAQQRQAVGPAAGALESWCPPNPRVPCHLCTGTLTAHAAGCPKAPKAPKTRVQRLPAAAAPCGLVMDGDRLDAHRAQCGACQGGKQAASYAGIDRTTAPALLPYYLVVASPCGYVGDSENSKKSHERVCRWCALTPDKAVPKTAKPAPAPVAKPAPSLACTCPHGPHTTDGKCPIHVTPGIFGHGFVGCACDKCTPRTYERSAWEAKQSIGVSILHNASIPERLPPPAPIPWTGVDDWDLLPDA